MPSRQAVVLPTSALTPVDVQTVVATPSPEAGGSAADYFSMGRKVKGRLSLSGVPLVDQQNYTSCGEAAFVMDWNFLHPAQPLDVEVVQAAGLELGVYFPSGLPGPHGYLGTSPAGMAAIGTYYADRFHAPPPMAGNLDLDMGDAYARQEALGLLFSQLSAGRAVIIEATDVIGEPSRTVNDSHYVVVTGMDFTAGHVFFNDPYLFLSTSGKYSGAARVAEWTDFWASWSRNRDINPGTGARAGRGWYMLVR